MPLPDAGRPARRSCRKLAGLRAADLDFTRATSYHFESGHGPTRRGRGGRRDSGGRNGLDPTAFPSVAVIENDLVGGAGPARRRPRRARHGDQRRHESCMLAVLGARER